MIKEFKSKISGIHSLREKHKGKEFVVFGGGPTIENFRNHNGFLDDKIVLCCNYKMDFINADYHMLHDPLSVMWWKKNNVDIEKSKVIFSDICLNYQKYNSDGKGKNPVALNPTHVRDEWLGDIPVQEYLSQMINCAKTSEDKFFYLVSPFYRLKERHNIVDENNSISMKGWYGSGFLLIDLALFLGASRIFLVGFDGGQSHSYENNPSDRHYRMKNRNITHWYQHRSRLYELSQKTEIILVNPEQSVYNGIVQGVKIN